MRGDRDRSPLVRATSMCIVDGHCHIPYFFLKTAPTISDRADRQTYACAIGKGAAQPFANAAMAGIDAFIPTRG